MSTPARLKKGFRAADSRGGRWADANAAHRGRGSTAGDTTPAAVTGGQLDFSSADAVGGPGLGIVTGVI